MDVTPFFSGDRDGPFERILCHLVLDGQIRVQSLTQDQMVGTFPDSPRVLVLLRCGAGSAFAIQEAAWCAREWGGEVVLVGGGPEAAKVLKDSIPAITQWGVSAWQVDGEVRLLTSRNGTVLTQMEATPPPNWPRFWETVSRKRAEDDEVRRHQSAVDAFHHRQGAIVSGHLVALFCVAYAIVHVIHRRAGSPDLSSTLYRLGALQRDAVLQGEIWRLASSTFLSTQFLHAVLGAGLCGLLGFLLEVHLGWARFILLYTVCALVGGLVCMWTGNSIAVGNGAALWGMIAALVALRYNRPGFVQVPNSNVGWSGRPGPRSVGLTFLLLCAMPLARICVMESGDLTVARDYAIGGAAAGAFLVLSGILTAGLPLSTDPGDGRVPLDRVPIAVRVAAVVLTSLFVVGGMVGMSR